MAQAVQFPHDDFGDRYAIERELGHGATATVYLARDLNFEDKLVAIKVLSADFALPVPSERFLREIQTTAKLNHPHIVTLLEAGRTRSAPSRPFYVMRYIDGETLRDVIARGPLGLPDALRIARQVAGALGHAHRHGVIHRDIKPGNIMIEEGHTWVTDFGIARAMAPTDGQTVTSTGVTIGTPAYMSPEQAMGRGDLDARSDIYSLGCVLYEMLAGKMPFEGPDIQVVLNKHLAEPLPPIRDLRPEVPERLERLLDIALAKKRDDRFATAVDFAEALSLEGAGALTPTRTQPVRGERRSGIKWTRRTSVAAGATLVAGVIVVAAWALTRPNLDPNRYFVAPRWEYGDGTGESMNVGRLVQDALNEWKGIRVSGEAPASTALSAGALARRAEAGWYVRGGVSRVGDSLRVRAALYGTRGDSLVRERVVNLAPSLSGADSAFARLADQLLFDDTVWSANGGRAGTRSVAARRAFGRGLGAIQRWDLGSADSAFRAATDADANYAQAHLWLAQVRFWDGADAATWRSPVERALVGSARLSSRDQMLALALGSLGRADIVDACRTWHRSTASVPNDFAGWYSLASCLSEDDVIVRDSKSPSGWSFRTSYHAAIKAYQRAFELLPSIHKALSGDSYAAVRQLLKTSADAVRLGHAASPDTTTFAAHPSWVDDTLAFVPYSRRRNDLATLGDMRLAVHRQRELFHDIATAWVSAAPASPEAIEALAVSDELLEDPAALEDIVRARRASVSPAQQVRLAVAEVWLRVKFSIPRDTAGLLVARDLADSLLASNPVSEAREPLALASVALLTGRVTRAAALSRSRAAEIEQGVPPQLSKVALPLLTFAAVGAPVDSIRELAEQATQAIDSRMLSNAQGQARIVWLARPARLAFPNYLFPTIQNLAHVDFLIDAQTAFLRGDTASVRRWFATVRAARRYLAPSDVAMEGVFAEASLLAAVGDTHAAIDWLDNSLQSLMGTAPGTFVGLPDAAALMRVMMLRAELAQRVGDTATAKRWARVVAILWAKRDDFLQPSAHLIGILSN